MRTRMQQRNKPEQPATTDRSHNDRWMISYADFITLLFAFFVVMYSLSSVNEGKYRVLSESLDAAFKSANRSMRPIQVGIIRRETGNSVVKLKIPRIVNLGLMNLPPPRYSEDKKKPGVGKQDPKKWSGKKTIRHVSRQIAKAMSPLIKQGLIDVNRNDNQVEVEINSGILFTSGSARLVRQAIPVLKQIANIIKPMNASVHIEGFTDNVPIRSALYRSNWELSAARAASVVHLFTRAGVSPRRMAAVGYAEFQPIASNRTASGRRKNRRVVLIINSTLNPRFSRKKIRSKIRSVPGVKVVPRRTSNKGTAPDNRGSSRSPGIDNRTGKFGTDKAAASGNTVKGFPDKPARLPKDVNKAGKRQRFKVIQVIDDPVDLPKMN